ncbi:MAG: peptidoglycan-associated lipoprotein Pal [Deltaproteobacteria bacterium]|nr:peptidoglycan-associated lipoprotein Pal [Deltaproteobacteria bacterium]MBI4374782.1 peptidoglycan-associated lipoprotein Pal [Deltaproteobacteria bacterium]
MAKKTTVAALAIVGMVLMFGCSKQGKPDVAGKTSKGLNRVHFDFDRSDIKDEYKKVLKGNAEYLKEHEKSEVNVEGHCDERGTEEYNIALGNRRANAARDYLASLGINKSRVKTKSFGEEKPIEKCSNESCWWKNRRAEFVKK